MARILLIGEDRSVYHGQTVDLIKLRSRGKETGDEGEQIRMTMYPGVERRSGKDRRRQALPMTKRLFYKGSRESMRRKEDRNRIVLLDRYKTSLVVSTLVILALSLLDAVLTLTLISQGAQEINPIMRYFLGHGAHVFLTVKYGLTALSALIIVVCHEVLVTRYRLASGILPLFAMVFGGVVIWEFYLLSISGCR